MSCGMPPLFLYDFVERTKKRRASTRGNFSYLARRHFFQKHRGKGALLCEMAMSFRGGPLFQNKKFTYVFLFFWGGGGTQYAKRVKKRQTCNDAAPKEQGAMPCMVLFIVGLSIFFSPEMDIETKKKGKRCNVDFWAPHDATTTRVRTQATNSLLRRRWFKWP